MIELHSLLKSYTIHNWLSNIWRCNSFIIICFSEHSLRFVLFVLLWLSDKDCCSHCMMNCVSNLCSFWSRSKRREERAVQQSWANTWPNSLQQKIELFLISQRIWNNVINGFWSQHKKQIISFLSFISEKTPDTPASLKLCIVWRHPSLWCHVSLLVLSLLIKGSWFTGFIKVLHVETQYLCGFSRDGEVVRLTFERTQSLRANQSRQWLEWNDRLPSAAVRVSARDKKNLIVVEWKMLSSDGFWVPFLLSCQIPDNTQWIWLWWPSG